jgi:hypothetical protein
MEKLLTCNMIDDVSVRKRVAIAFNPASDALQMARDGMSPVFCHSKSICSGSGVNKKISDDSMQNVGLESLVTVWIMLRDLEKTFAAPVHPTSYFNNHTFDILRFVGLNLH